MDNPAQKMIELTAAIGLFIGALTIGAMLFIKVSQAVEITNKFNVGQDRNIHTTLAIPKKYEVTGAEVLQSIYHIGSIGADIQVDGQEFFRNLDINHMDVSKIDVHRSYVPTYIRDENGGLSKIIFNPQ